MPDMPANPDLPTHASESSAPSCSSAMLADRDARPWRYYELDRETLQRMCEQLANRVEALSGAPGSSSSPPVPGGSVSEALRAIIEQMRAEGPRYKSHDLGFVDSVSANRVDEWADEIEQLLAEGRITSPPSESKS